MKKQRREEQRFLEKTEAKRFASNCAEVTGKMSEMLFKTFSIFDEKRSNF
jgi:hypothetical protein